MRAEGVSPRDAGSQRYGLPHPLLLLVLTMMVLCMAFAVTGVGAAGAAPTPQRAEQLVYMVRQDCGSCHGMTLAGGLGPPLSPAALAGKPEGYLKHVILNGSRNTAMPGWSPLLSEVDAEWIAERLLAGFPDAR